jgi:hypothetical protein
MPSFLGLRDIVVGLRRQIRHAHTARGARWCGFCSRPELRIPTPISTRQPMPPTRQLFNFTLQHDYLASLFSHTQTTKTEANEVGGLAPQPSRCLPQEETSRWWCGFDHSITEVCRGCAALAMTLGCLLTTARTRPQGKMYRSDARQSNGSRAAQHRRPEIQKRKGST